MYDPTEDADSELVGNPPEENPPTVTPTHGASPEPRMNVVLMDDTGVVQVSVDVPGLHAIMADIFGDEDEEYSPDKNDREDYGPDDIGLEPPTDSSL
jgi:hypothetical protein